MKIALIANTDWYLFNYRQILAKDLNQAGFEVILISPPGPYAATLEENGFQWFAWKVGRKTLSPLGEVKAIIRLTKIYLKQKPDLVHHFTLKSVLYGSVAARLAKIPGIINSITGLGYFWLSADRAVRLLRPVVKVIIRLTLLGKQNVTIFENEGDRDYFISEKIIPVEKTMMIPGVGVDTDRFTPSPEPPGKPVVLFPSRMLWDKGLGILIEATRYLHKNYDVRVVLAGKPDPGNPTSVDELVIQQWEREGLIEYWGWMDDMVSAYHQCHIVVLPSFYEGLPTSLIEAASCGRPIVATDVSGCRAIVKNGVNGFLVPVNDVKSLVSSLGKLILNGNLRRQMGDAGRKIVLDTFAVQKINKCTMAVYDSFINDNRVLFGADEKERKPSR